jgi:hypothetical protein
LVAVVEESGRFKWPGPGVLVVAVLVTTEQRGLLPVLEHLGKVMLEELDLQARFMAALVVAVLVVSEVMVRLLLEETEEREFLLL